MSIDDPIPNASAKPRRARFTLIGRFDHVPAKNRNPAAILHLAQAGLSVVGWFATPNPTFVRNPSIDKLKTFPPMFENIYPFGGLYSTDVAPPINPPIPNAILFNWGFYPHVPKRSQDFSGDPDKFKTLESLVSCLADDPCDVSYSNTGLIAGVDAPNAIGREITVFFDLPNRKRFDLNEGDRFIQRSLVPRVSNTTFLTLWQDTLVEDRSKPFVTYSRRASSKNPPLKDLPLEESLVVNDLLPLPQLFINHEVRRFCPSPEDPQSVVSKLQEWQLAFTGDPKIRREIRAQFVPLWRADWMNVPAAASYRPIIAAAIKQALLETSLELKQPDGTKKVKTYNQWLLDLRADELDYRTKTLGKGGAMGELIELFDHLRVAATDNAGPFRYTLKFKPLSVPVLGKALFGNLSTAKLGVGIGGKFFEVDIVKERVSFKVNSDGAFEYKDGEPVLSGLPTSGKDCWRCEGFTLSGTTYPAATGFYMSYGVGLKLGWSKSKGGSSKVGGPDDDLGTVALYSFWSLQPEDFNCSFTVTLLGGPSVKGSTAVGDLGSVETGRSQLFELYFKARRLQITAVLTDKAKLKGPKLKLPSLNDSADAYIIPSLSVALFDFGQGHGTINPVAGKISRGSSVPMPSATQSTSLHTQNFVYFSKDSYNIDELKPPATDTLPTGQNPGHIQPNSIPARPTLRGALELFLATELRLAAGGDTVIDVLGYTSPEATAQYNQVLSERRAGTTRMAIIDALQATSDVSQITINVRGLGEAPSLERSSGLSNPPDPEPPDWRSLHADEVAKWPQWRKTEIFIDKVLVAKMSE